MSNNSNIISFGDGIPENIMQAQFASVTVPIPTSQAHACRIVLPKSSIQATDLKLEKIEPDKLTAVADYQLPGDALVRVLASIFPNEINLVDWLSLEADNLGIELQRVKSTVDANGQVVHAVGRWADQSHLRFVVKSNGSNVVMLVGQAPRDADDAIKETLGLAAASLDLTLPLGQKLMEPLIRYRDPASYFCFMHPVSWTASPIKPPRPLLAAADLRITSDTDTIAYIRVKADWSVAHTDEGRQQFCENFSEEIQESGISLNGLEPLEPLPARKTMERYFGPCILPGGEGVVALGIEPIKEGWVGVFMVCPGRTMNPVGWLRGKRTFEIVMATLGEV